MPQAPAAVATLSAALEDMAMTYRGSSDFGHMYGVQMKDATARQFTIASEQAFFSRVWEQVAETQPRIILFTAYVPIENTIMATAID
jgi:hypothetical protein